LLAVGLLNVIFATFAGLWGVLVIDLIQFLIMMTSVFGAAYFAVTLPQVGGLGGLMEKLSTTSGPGGLNYLNLLPDFTNNWELAVAVFVMPLAVQWWAVWYPGAEPGGGSYIAQRMLSSKSERDSLGGSLFFNVAHYVLRPWPWILIGLASLVVYPELADIGAAFPNVDPELIGHDIAYPAMLIFLPAGWIGLMVGGLVAANSSTVLTHLNWGASYLVHDFYRRFLNREASEREYVFAGRLATVGLFVFSSALVFVLETAQDNFNLMLQIGAGTGLLYLLRWFWWRVTAWCEIVAMVSSFAISVGVLFLRKGGVNLGTHRELILTVLFTTVCWLAAVYLGPQTDRRTLVEFYRKVHPPGPGWKAIRIEAGIPAEDAARYAAADNVPLAILGWVAGTAAIWSSLFTVGNFLYGRTAYGTALLGVFLASGSVLVWVVRKLWR
jgi:Na+/proline symporter